MTDVLPEGTAERPDVNISNAMIAEFDAFYRATYRDAERAARLAAGDKLDAVHDVVQNAYFIYLQKMPERGNDANKNRNYLITIVINEMRGWHRSAKRELLLGDDAVERARLDPAFATVDTSDEIQQFLQDLPPALRDVALLRYLGELTVSEIAKERGVSKSTVRSQLQELRVQFKRKLGWGGPGEGEQR